MEAPEHLDWGNLDQYSEDEIEAYNQAAEERLSKRIEQLGDTEQAALAALEEEARVTEDSATVTLRSGTELEVRTRITPHVENLAQRFQRLQERQRDGAPIDVEHMRRVGAELVAGMVLTDGFDEPDVWVIAAKRQGMQFLSEVSDRILAPMQDRIDKGGPGN